MDYFVGKICPYCKTEIKEGEAVTVCPSCGIAHHEGCWNENRGCTTFGCEQQNSVQTTTVNTVCPNCGKEHVPGAEFCPYCGTSFSASAQAPQWNANPAQPGAYPAGNMQPTFTPAQAQAPQFNANPAQPGAYPAGNMQPTFTPAPGGNPKPKINADMIADKIAKKGSRIVAYICGLFSGLASIVLGIVSFCLDTGSYLHYESYGGDAYTGIQHASAGAGNNVRALADIVKFGFGSLLLVVGVAICCFFVSKIIEAKTKE